ncbi:hypothetical protein [Rarobacter incanus]|uniref:Peptidase inhibitor family I36 n=1 Tax=Rarobacter incanus TaxID=153494 RepID=A0A542SPI4_9MICO|nr:hypothetical protein [Rarobacter incanus]TQK76530.1 hypothetical protein FB389_1209 [Rarobacter incanus]
MQRRTRLATLLAALVMMGAVLGGAPAQATQTINELYCGTAGIYGQFQAWNNNSTHKAGTQHTTGPTCPPYKVRIKYETSGGGQTWMTWKSSGPTGLSVVQTSTGNYTIVQAQHSVPKNGATYTVNTY